MNGVLGMSELLGETELDETQRHYTNVIYNSGRTLLNVINEILDYSKIAAGKMQLESHDFDIVILGQECISLFSAQAREKHIELIYRIDPEMPIVWVGDEMRIRRVVINLFSNAFKFTDAGEVMLNISCCEEVLRVDVKDTGVGINEVQLPNLFQEFSQADSSTSRKYGGTGLGLTICKQLLEIMGGEISVSSQYGVGSLFSFTLPLHVLGEKNNIASAVSSNCSQYRLLLVDDNSHYREVMVEWLSCHELEIHEAANGKIALEMIDSERVQGRSYNLIAIDLDMPEMDGITLVKCLHKNGFLSESKAVLLSSTGQLPMPAEYESWGVSLAVQKPILAEDLYRLFARLLGEKLQLSDISSAFKGPASIGVERRVLNILVAEDNDVNFQVVSTMLRKMGHRVHRAINGLEALVEFKSHNLNARAQAYDFIFMDCEMPEMDGFDSTRAIRQLEQSREMAAIPIVALTAHASGDRLKLCTAAGMDAYLSKPIQSRDIERIIESMYQLA